MLNFLKKLKNMRKNLNIHNCIYYVNKNLLVSKFLLLSLLLIRLIKLKKNRNSHFINIYND